MEQLKEFHSFKMDSQLTDIGNLKDNWNGYGGQKIDKKVIKLVETIISNLNIEVQLSPTGRGTIQLEIYKNDETFIEIEIGIEKSFIYLMKNSDEIEEEIKTNVKDIIRKINSFNGR